MTALAAGTQLGPYEILAPIGAGGMGEVYKAADRRLERTVAMKLLPRHWAENTEMRQRFEREAQIIGSLNHPNICVLHDIGKQDGYDFLVMEYLEGDTLAARIERGAMPWDEALRVAIAMADALDKAHRKGVVHRDLKPSNVILSESGPKLLDFGLAKWQTPAGPSSAPSSATQMVTRSDVTLPGSLLGTLQYMAPEQLEGMETDARTDIFAFGAVLHEMLTGKKAFEGKSRVLLMSAIATAEPEPLSKTQPEVPAALEHVVKTCLAKDPLDRWQTARDLLAELEWVAQTGAEAGFGAPISGSRRKRRTLARALAGGALLLAVAVAVPAALYLRGAAPPEEVRFRVPISLTAQPANPNFAVLSMAGANFAVSPDGYAMAFVAAGSGGRGGVASLADTPTLFFRPIGSVTPRRLAGTENAELPFWSADGRFIGFVAAGKLRKVEASGGPPQDVCDAPGFSGGTWNREGTIVFGSTTGLWRVSAEGGKPEAVSSLEPGESGHFWPHFLPDGRRYLYTAWTREAARRAIVAGTLGSKEKVRVLAAESNAAYAEPGFLLFHRRNTVYAQPFQWKQLALSGEPARVADGTGYSEGDGRGNFAVSPNGVLIYFQPSNGNTSLETGQWQLAWIDRAGQVLETVGPPGVYWGVEASPDGKRVAVHRHEPNGGDIVVIEPRGSTTRLTFDASHHNSGPVWSPNGDRIAYSALQKGKWGLYQVLSSGSGTEELLYESDAPKAPMSWSPDGKRIVFWVQDAKNGGDLWVLPLDGDKKPAPLIASPFQETHGQISPDGKWIAYTSNSTGRNEIYVQPFPSGAGRWQVSFHGGDWPRWRGDSKELFYHSIASTLDSPAMTGVFRFGPVLSAAVTARGDALEAAIPQEIVRIFANNMPHTGGDYQFYAVSADGKRILMGQVAGLAGAASGGAAAIGPDPGRPYISVAMNWAASLKK